MQRQQHKTSRNMKNQGNMTPPKEHNTAFSKVVLEQVGNHMGKNKSQFLPTS